MIKTVRLIDIKLQSADAVSIKYKLSDILSGLGWVYVHGWQTAMMELNLKSHYEHSMIANNCNPLELRGESWKENNEKVYLSAASAYFPITREDSLVSDAQNLQREMHHFISPA